MGFIYFGQGMFLISPCSCFITNSSGEAWQEQLLFKDMCIPESTVPDNWRFTSQNLEVCGRDWYRDN